MQDITQNNTLLAEFLGWKLDESNELWQTTSHDLFYHHELEFSTDWNQLMLVVDKIENTDSPKEGLSWSDYKPFSAQIDRCDCEILVDGLATGHKLRGDDVPYIGSDRKSESKIEATYNACVEFVKWYNETK